MKYLQDKCPLVNLNEGWFIDDIGTSKGNRKKLFATPSGSSSTEFPGVQGSWFWKTSLPRYPIEFWSEVLAFHIGAAIEVGVPPCVPAVYGEEYGALSQNLVDVERGEVLIHAGDVLAGVMPEYERKKGTDHSVQLIERTLKQLGLFEDLYPKLFEQFVFDAILGNGDRHQDNWGFVVRTMGETEVKLLPAFDNGSSLGRELPNGRLGRLLDGDTYLDRYITRGQAHVRWLGASEGPVLTHEQLVQHHLREYPWLKPVAERILQFDYSNARTAIGLVCTASRACIGVELTEEREEFICRLIMRRQARLLALLENA